MSTNLFRIAANKGKGAQNGKSLGQGCNDKLKKMKKHIFFISFVLLAASAFAGGETALPFLKLDMGARYYGLAGAASALADDATGASFYNPAAAGHIKSFQLAATTFEDKLDFKAYYAGAGLPLGYLSFFGNAPLNVLLSAFIYDKGYIEENPGFSRSVGKDASFALTIAENIFSNEWNIDGNSLNAEHYLGVTAKYLTSSLPMPAADGGGSVKADGFAIDAGYQAVVNEYFGLGFAALNLGSKIKYIEEEDPLPATVRGGIFYTPVYIDGVEWSLSADYISYLKEDEDRIRLGTEFVFLDVLAIRGGAKLFEEIQNEYTLGAGLKLLGFEVEFATTLNPQFNEDKQYQMSIAYKFPVKKTAAYAERGKGEREAARRERHYEYERRKSEQSWRQAAKDNDNPLLYQ
jgi:hypothetical protein